VSEVTLLLRGHRRCGSDLCIRCGVAMVADPPDVAERSKDSRFSNLPGRCGSKGRCMSF
jgi:hypothetical protein